MGGGREKRHGCGSGVGASTVPGGPSVCGRGALADTWWGLEAAGQRGRNGAKQHAGGGHAFSGIPAGVQGEAGSFCSQGRRGFYQGVVSPFPKRVFSRKAKAGNTQLAKKSAKHSSSTEYSIWWKYLPCLLPGYNNKQFVKRIADKGRVIFLLS